MFRAFKFWVVVYVSDDASKQMHPAHVTEKAFNEHEARRHIIEQYHAAGVCVYWLELDH